MFQPEATGIKRHDHCDYKETTCPYIFGSWNMELKRERERERGQTPTHNSWPRQRTSKTLRLILFHYSIEPRFVVAAHEMHIPRLCERRVLCLPSTGRDLLCECTLLATTCMNSHPQVQLAQPQSYVKLSIHRLHHQLQSM